MRVPAAGPAVSASTGWALRQAAAKAPEPEKIESLLTVDMVSLEVGYGLIALVDGEQSGELLDRIKSIRRQLAQDMGFVVPPLHIRDNLDLSPNAYRITLNGVAVGESPNGDNGGVPSRSANPFAITEVRPGPHSKT